MCGTSWCGRTPDDGDRGRAVSRHLVADEALRARLRRLLDALGQGLIERTEAVRLSLLAALAGEHLLLLGPPGTAKSELARRLQSILAGGHYFERLLTRFSVPEELFGPLSIRALEADRYERLTDGYLPQATVAFIDEIFKANSAILNALLTLLNERAFDNGTQRIHTPLVCVIAASNELPDEEELEALYDRFLLRHQVSPVSQAGFRRLLALETQSGKDIDPSDRIDPGLLSAIRQNAADLPLTEDTLLLLEDLREALLREDIRVSDRRWRQALGLLRVAAWTDGATEVQPWQCRLLEHCLWQTPEQQPRVRAILGRLLGMDTDAGAGESAGSGIRRLQRLVAAWHETLEEDRARSRPVTDEDGHPLYLDAQGRQTRQARTLVSGDRDGEPLYLAPPGVADRTNAGAGYTRDELQHDFFDDHFRQTHIDGHWVGLDDYLADPDNRLQAFRDNTPLTEPWLWSERHIESRQAEIRQLQQEIGRQKGRIEAQLEQLREQGDPLWHDAEWLQAIAHRLQSDLARIDTLIADLEHIHDGFARLPRKEHEPA